MSEQEKERERDSGGWGKQNKILAAAVASRRHVPLRRSRNANNYVWATASRSDAQIRSRLPLIVTKATGSFPRDGVKVPAHARC